LTEEEAAETYFNQLTRRKIIRPVEHSSHGKVKTFQVHDMVLEYIVSKSSEENFITVVGGHWMMPAPSPSTFNAEQWFQVWKFNKRYELVSGSITDHFWEPEPTAIPFIQ
jgi:hypothetical protein